MNLNFKNLIRCTAAFICGASLFACTDLGELEERVDNLDSRVTALENSIKSLNSSIEAVQTLLDGQLFITSIEESATAGEYTITMNDGSTLTIKEGQIGNNPLISVDEEGYWIVSYDNGKIYSRIEVNGKDMEVTAAPRFRVNDAGNWEISTDGGETWSPVYYTDGTTPVPAADAGDSFFQAIEFDEETGTIEITLADGQSYSFTVTKDFSCQIIHQDGPELFSEGATRKFDVKMRGVGDVYIQTPNGWKASLEYDASDPTAEVTGTLTVIAPVLTKVSADSDRDIVLHAVAAVGDRSIFSKIAVEMTTAAMPEVKITVGEVTSNSISYTLEPNNDVTEWKYMLLPESADAPAAAADFDDRATVGSATSLTLSEDAEGNKITAGTTYVLYVLATAGAETKITNASATPQISNYYDAYMAGEDIRIGDKVYNKTTYGEPAHITKENPSINTTYTVPTDPEAASSPRIYFVDPDANATYDATTNVIDMVIIGTENGTRSKLTINQQIKLNKGSNNPDYSGQLVVYNIDFDASTLANYPLAQNWNGYFEYVIFLNCKIKCNPTGNRPLSYVNAVRGYADFNMLDCQYELTSATQNYVINIGSQTSAYGKLNIQNTIFYKATGSGDKFMIFNGKSGSVDRFTFNNNTIVNLHTNSTFLINVKSLNTVEMKNNLIFNDQTMANNSGFLRIEDVSAETPVPPASASVTNNIVYNTDDAHIWQSVYNGKTITGVDNINVITENPFTGGTFDLRTGTFIPNATYSAYGSDICR